MNTANYPASQWLKDYGRDLGVDLTLNDQGICYVNTKSRLLLQLMAKPEVDCVWLHIFLCTPNESDRQARLIQALALNLKLQHSNNISICTDEGQTSLFLSRVILAEDLQKDTNLSLFTDMETRALEVAQELDIHLQQEHESLNTEAFFMQGMLPC